MARLTMISTKAHRYGNKLYKPGEFFTVPGRSDATLLEKLGRARLAEVVEQAPVRAVVDTGANLVHRIGEPEKKRRGRPRKVKAEESASANSGADTEGGE